MKAQIRNCLTVLAALALAACASDQHSGTPAEQTADGQEIGTRALPQARPLMEVERPARALVLQAAVPPLPASTPGAVSPALSGPKELPPGAKGTFELKLLMSLPPARTGVIQSASFTFASREAGSAVASLGKPSGAPASLFATLSFPSPGSHWVSVSGTVVSVQNFTEAKPVYETRSTYNPSCSCWQSSTVLARYDYVQRQEVQSQQLFAQQQVTVKP